jgi:hypothetical protein
MLRKTREVPLTPVRDMAECSWRMEGKSTMTAEEEEEWLLKYSPKTKHELMMWL